MPFCPTCGLPVEGQFCSNCGKPASAPPAAAGVTENVAALFCYPLGFITGILFLALAPYNQNKFIRFHAFQSIFLSAVWIAVWIVESIVDRIALMISWRLLGSITLLWSLVGLAFLLLVVILMVKAYQGQRFKLPVIGDLAEKQV